MCEKGTSSPRLLSTPTSPDHGLSLPSPLGTPPPTPPPLGFPLPKLGLMITEPPQFPNMQQPLAVDSAWPRPPLTSPPAYSSPVPPAAAPMAPLHQEACSASSDPELRVARVSSRFSGSSAEEDHEVSCIVRAGGVGSSSSSLECERKSATPGSCGSSTKDDEADNPRFKTEICRNYKEKGNCLYGTQCQFAHGSDEMRDSGKQNKYKTKLCQKYWIHGYCAYGARCNFLHNEEEGGGLPQKRRKASGCSGTGGGVDTSGDTQRWLASLRSSGGGIRSRAASASGGDVPAVLPPLSALHRPRHGSGRLAAYTQNNDFTWIDTWTKKIVS